MSGDIINLEYIKSNICIKTWIVSVTLLFQFISLWFNIIIHFPWQTVSANRFESLRVTFAHLLNFRRAKTYFNGLVSLSGASTAAAAEMSRSWSWTLRDLSDFLLDSVTDRRFQRIQYVVAAGSFLPLVEILQLFSVFVR